MDWIEFLKTPVTFDKMLVPVYNEEHFHIVVEEHDVILNFLCGENIRFYDDIFPPKLALLSKVTCEKCRKAFMGL